MHGPNTLEPVPLDPAKRELLDKLKKARIRLESLQRTVPGVDPAVKNAKDRVQELERRGAGGPGA